MTLFSDMPGSDLFERLRLKLPLARKASVRDDSILLEHNAVASALLASTSDLLACDSRDHILRGLCEAVVAASPRIRLAWAWVGMPGAAAIAPQVSVGPAAAYAESLVIPRTEQGLREPAFAALFGREAPLMDLRAAPSPVTRAEAARHGLREVLALPVRMPAPGERGVFLAYSDKADYFERMGVVPFRAIVRFAESALTREHLARELEREASHDALTGLLNRRALENALHREMQLASRHGKEFSVVMFDIDRFKHINDTHGHEVGDRVLREVARVSSAQLRLEDRLARWGGEEFMCVLPETSLEHARIVAEKIRAAIARHFFAEGSPVPNVNASFGVVTKTAGDGLMLDDLLRIADQRLYASKAQGRNRVTDR